VQLKREINDAVSSIQLLKTHLESIDKSLVDSQKASAIEKALKDRSLDLEKEVEELRTELKKKEDAFATSTLALDMNYGKRVRDCKEELENKSREEADRQASAQRELQTQLDMARKEYQTLKDAETTTRQSLEARLKESEDMVKDTNKKMRGKNQKDENRYGSTDRSS
jgi:hypothetical protein